MKRVRYCLWVDPADQAPGAPRGRNGAASGWTASRQTAIRAFRTVPARTARPRSKLSKLYVSSFQRCATSPPAGRPPAAPLALWHALGLGIWQHSVHHHLEIIRESLDLIIVGLGNRAPVDRKCIEPSGAGGKKHIRAVKGLAGRARAAGGTKETQGRPADREACSIRHVTTLRRNDFVPTMYIHKICK